MKKPAKRKTKPTGKRVNVPRMKFYKTVKNIVHNKKTEGRLHNQYKEDYVVRHRGNERLFRQYPETKKFRLIVTTIEVREDSSVKSKTLRKTSNKSKQTYTTRKRTPAKGDRPGFITKRTNHIKYLTIAQIKNDVYKAKVENVVRSAVDKFHKGKSKKLYCSSQFVVGPLRDKHGLKFPQGTEGTPQARMIGISQSDSFKRWYEHLKEFRLMQSDLLFLGSSAPRLEAWKAKKKAERKKKRLKASSVKSKPSKAKRRKVRK